MPTVQLPNGTLLEFPDGMSEDDMRTAIGANFPEYAAPKESGGLMGMLGNARQAIREFAGTTPEQIAADKAPAKDTSGGVMAGMDGTYAPERKPAAADPFAAPDTLGIDSNAAKMARVNQKYASTAAADMFSPAADARARQLVRNGMSGDLANQVAADAAARGLRPGQESGMDRIEKTDFDFDAQKKFNDDPFFKSPAVRGAVKGFEGYKQGVLGLNQFVGEMFGADVSGQARLAKESRGFTSAMGESNDHLQRNFEGAITSIAQQIPMLIGGAVTGSEGLVLGSIFVQSFGQEYSDGRAKGQSEGEATTRAGLFGAFEVIGEKFGLKAEMDMLRRSASGVETNVLAKWMANTLKKELPGEMLTTAGQFGTDKLGNGIGLHQDANLSDFLSQMGDTITQTMMQGGIMGGATGGLNQAARYIKGEADSTARLDAGDAQRDALQKWNTNGLSPSANTRPAPRADGQRIEPTWADTSTGPTVPVPPVAPAVRAEPTIDDVMSAKTVDEALAAAQAIASKPIASPYATAADIDALERQADMRDAVPAPELANLPGLASSDGIDLAASPIPTDERPAPSAWRQAVDIVTPGNTAPREDAQAPAATPQRDAIDRIIDPAADWHAFPSGTGTLGIPRADMPQIKAEHRGAMVNFLNARGITHEQIEVPAETFKPTQAEFSLDKVLKAQEFAGGNRSILVSADNYVLDGHHQWLAAVDNNEPVKAIRLGAPIAELLQAVKEFPSTTVAEGAPDTAPVLSETAASARLDTASAPAGQRKSTGGSRARDRVHTENPFLGFLATHGVNINERADAGAERGRAGNPMVPGFGPIFRKTGLRFDELATAAQQAGFLTQADIDSENDTGGTRKLADMIERATQGKEVIRPAGTLENDAPGAHDQLLQEAHNLGIDAQGMTPDQVYDAVIKAHDTLEQHRAVTGAATVDEQDEIAHYADQFTPEETALILDLDADISLDGGESTEHLTDREINELFTIQSKPATAQADGRQTEGNPGIAAGKGNQGTEEQGDILAGYTRDEVIQKQDAEAERAKALEVERAKLDAAARRERDQKDITERQAIAADNFTLDAQVNDAAEQKKADAKRTQDQLAGQDDIFNQPAYQEPPGHIEGELSSLDGMFDQLLAEETAAKPVSDLGELFDGILAEEVEGQKSSEPAAVPVAEKVPTTGIAGEKAKIERARNAKTAPAVEPAKPKKITKQKAAEARVLAVLGAKVGDTVTMTFKGNVGYLTSGKPMIVASISSSAEVNFKDANKESFTSEKLSMLEAFARNPATALTWEVTPAPVEQRSASEAAKSAAKNAAVGLAAAVQGLGELFGGNISDKAGIIEDFDESKYRKAAPMFQAAIDSFGAAGADIKEVMRAVIKAVIAQFGAQVTANMKPYVVRFVQDYQDGKLDGGNNVAGTSGNTERDSGQRENGEQGLEPAVLDVPGPDNGRARQDRAANRSEGARPGDSAGVSGRNAADGRAARDQRIPVGEWEGGLAPGPAESGNADRGGNRGNAQSQSQSNAIGEPATALGARLSLDDKRAEQRAAESVQVIAGDRDNITATLPFLLEGQRDDVHFAEQRFANGDKQPGVMFTNGTGTGKTYSGLGIAKRFARQGKTEGVIVVPNNQIAADWIKSGRDLGLDIKPLDSTSENGGKGIIVTTYANFGDNSTLADRKWDWVMADEAHYLMASKDGKQTKALSTLQAITRHPDGFYQYSRMKNRALYAQLDALKPPSKSDGNQPDRAAFDRIAKKIREADDALFPEYQAAATSPLARPKAVFLSATPFAYVKSVDYANGYLFEYQRRDSSAYNSGDGREAFFMQHFGYRMRYNKLTQPDGAVDEGLMARQFNTYLKREGALSGRMLDVEADYQRRFHMVESALGTKIDEGLEFIREHAEYKHLYEPMMKQFDYLRRRFLLEAIKATESLPMIREHLALGRKVAIVHDYKKGGAFNPFQMAGINGTATEYVGNEPKAFDLAELAAKFRAERSDLVRLEFPTQSALQILGAAFPDALVHNGDVPAKQLEMNKKQFNADTDEHRIIILQSDKGREGISLHDTTGRYQRVEVNIGLPSKPTALIQLEGRIYRTGQSSDAIFDYVNTGTMWERWTFAQTIAERADTAEALAMGDLARGLKDSIIEAFEASDAHPITADDGKGGKARDRQNAKLLSEWDRAKSFYFGQQKKTSRNKAAEGKDYFATPEPLGLKMVEWADIRPGEDVAEPSAGHGAIARWFPVQSNKTIVEPSTELITRARLVVEGEAKFVQSNFEDLHIVNKYDAIVMNPPFGVGGSVAIPHLAKAYAHLRDGGRIVAIIPTGPAADAKFDKFLYGDKAPKDLYLITSIALPGATFGRAGTGAMTRIVILDKVSDASKAPDTRSVYNRDFTSAEDVGELFDELEHMALPGRVKTVLPVEIAIEEAKPELKPKAAKKSARAAAPDAVGAERFYAQFEFKHTKTGEELFGAAMLNRVSMDTYKQANAIAKENGGWYNKFAGGGAQRGFLFKSADERATFMQAAGQLDEVGDGLDAQNSRAQEDPDILTSRATTFDPGRRQLLAAAAAAAMSTGANAGDLKVGKAAPINPAVLAQRVAPAIEKILRDGQAAGTTSLNGTAMLRKAMKAIALTGPKEVRALAALVEKLLPTSGTIALTVDDTRRMNVHGVVELAPFVHLSLFTAEGRTGLSYETVLHEALHVAVAARYRSLSAGMVRGNDAIMGLSVPQAASALKQFENVWEEFRTATAAEKFGSQQIELAVAEARGNPDEFFVRTLTDPVLQAYMAGKQYEGKTLWARFKDWVKSSLFGFSKSGTAPSWLDAALAASSDVADAMGADKADFSRMTAISRAQAQRENSRVAGPDTMESRALPDPTWTDPEMTRLDNVIHTLQDKQIDMRRVVQAIRSEMGELEDKWNPYLQEELFHGRSATGFKDYLHNELRPLLSDMQARGVTMEEFEEYLHMRHAEEANVQVASINPDMPDKGSGIATKDARDYLANQAPDKLRAFEALAQRIDAMTAETQRLLVDYSLEKQDTIDAWNATYQHYVPLFREDMDAGKMGNGTGQGYSVRGSSSKRRMGSERAVVNIIANIAMARERAIVRGEKNRLDLALYGLALKAPNPEFWRPINPMKNPDALADELDAMGLSPEHVVAIIDEPRQRVIDKRTGLVVKRLNPLLRSARNVVAVRVNGEDRFVFFNEKNERAMRMAITLKNMGNDGLNRFLSVAGFVTRQFAAINTQYNPIFGLVNLTRDTQEAAINLTDTPIAGRQHEVIGEAARLFALVVSRNFNLEKLTGADAALWHEFQQEGGITGFRAMFGSSDDRAREIAKEMKRMTAGPASKPFHALAEWLSNYNEALENITRMSVYKTAKAHGLTNQQSASLAKSLTVNFNRKGAISSQMGSLYAFFNAAVQGTARMAQTLTGPAGKKIIAGGLLLGVMQAVMMAAAGYDDEDPPEFVKERNVVIPLGWITGKKNYLTIPMPLGFSFIPTLGRLGTEFGLRGGKNAGKFLGKMAGSLLDAFNPLGSSTLLQTIAPTGIDPLAALAENRDWTGKPISRNDLNGLKPTPGYTRAKDTASGVSKTLAYYLNAWTGGTKYTPGALSPTPDQIDYLLGTFTGGVGREILKTQQTVSAGFSGEELPTYKIPLAGRFYGNAGDKSSVSTKFYANLLALNIAAEEVTGRAKDHANPREFLNEHPEARLADLATAVHSEISQLRKYKQQQLEKGDKARVKEIELRMRTLMENFNSKVDAAKQKAPA